MVLEKIILHLWLYLNWSMEYYHGFENNMLTVGMFLDLKKAFDTVNHDILNDKMSLWFSW